MRDAARQVLEARTVVRIMDGETLLGVVGAQDILSVIAGAGD